MNDPRIIIEKGRLTGEPEIKQTKTGKTLMSFTVAGNGSHKDKTTGEYVDDCQIFVRCTIWDTALFPSMQQLLHKGTLVRLDTACCPPRPSSSRRSSLISLPLPRRPLTVMTRGERSSESWNRN